MENNLGERSMQIMINKDITPYKLYKASKISQSTIGRILKNESIPNGSTIEAIARALDVSSTWLSTGVDSGLTKDEEDNLVVNDPKEQIPTKAGHIVEELPNGKYKLWTKKVPVKAFASYLSEFRNAEYFEELEDVAWTVDHNPRGRYMTFGTEGDSMNGGGIYDSMDGAELLGRELLKHHWRDGFRDSLRGWVIVHRETMVHKDIRDFNPETGDLICHSRSGLPNHPDFTINLNDVLEIWKVIKIAQ